MPQTMGEPARLARRALEQIFAHLEAIDKRRLELDIC